MTRILKFVGGFLEVKPGINQYNQATFHFGEDDGGEFEKDDETGKSFFVSPMYRSELIELRDFLTSVLEGATR